MTMNPMLAPQVLPYVPAFIAKRGKGGTGVRGALQYDHQKFGAQLVITNLEGATPREWSQQMARFRQANPKLKRAVDHWSLSLDPRLGQLSNQMWAEAVTTFLERMGYQDCPFVCHRHTDEPHDHSHITVLRLRFNAKGRIQTVDDSNDFKRSHLASAAAAESVGLKPMQGSSEASNRAIFSDQIICANRRAKRLNGIESHPDKILAAVQAALPLASTSEQLVHTLAGLGIDACLRRRGSDQNDTSAQVCGWSLRQTGSNEWLGAASISRSIGWAKVKRRLDQQFELSKGENEQEACQGSGSSTDQLGVGTVHVRQDLAEFFPSAGQRSATNRSAANSEIDEVKRQIDLELRDASVYELIRMREYLQRDLVQANKRAHCDHVGTAVLHLIARIARLVLKLFTLAADTLPRNGLSQRRAVTEHMLRLIGNEEGDRNGEVEVSTSIFTKGLETALSHGVVQSRVQCGAMTFDRNPIALRIVRTFDARRQIANAEDISGDDSNEFNCYERNA